MLTSLTIKNYALIGELSVTFETGLNIITGETGAGKSIIIDALSLTLGDRADAAMVRKGAEKAIVEAVFDAADRKKLAPLFTMHDLDLGPEIIVRREVSVKGQSRAFVNDTPVSTAVLREIGDCLVDLHGQHEHQSLLRADTHVDLLDDFGGLQALVDEFAASYRKVQELFAELGDLQSREDQLMERKELYTFQLNEIEQVDPRHGEESDLEAELIILENAEKLFSATERLHQLLYEGDNAVHDQLILARNELDNLAAIDRRFEESRNEVQSAAAIVDELAKFIQYYNSRIEFNPERLDAIRNRLGQIALLKKKYGGSLDAVITLREKIGADIALAENFQEEIASLRTRMNEERKCASGIAERLTAKRHETARKINKGIVTALAGLGIPNAVFETVIGTRPAADPETAVVRRGREWLACSARGADTVEFHVSTNAGEDPKPLVKVASGGEISRIMLALKMVLAKSDRLPLLVFDEIDVGVSGRIAQAVGTNLKTLSQFHQIIAITHLPQIAGLADVHFVVEKSETGGRSTTRMRSLGLEERVTEVARLLSGIEVTDSGLESARELMGMTERAKSRKKS